MENSVAVRSQLIEAKVVGSIGTGTRYAVLDVPDISQNNVMAYAIETFGYNQLVASPKGNTVIGGAATSQGPISQATLTLVDNKKQQFINQIPLYSLVRANNGGDLFYFAPRILNLTDCFIQLTATTNVALNEVAIFNIYYYKTKS